MSVCIGTVHIFLAANVWPPQLEPGSSCATLWWSQGSCTWCMCCHSGQPNGKQPPAWESSRTLYPSLKAATGTLLLRAAAQLPHLLLAWDLI